MGGGTRSSRLLNRIWPAPAGTTQNSSNRAIGVHSDVTSSISVQELVKRTLAEFGRLDILVNSAAIDPKFDPAHEVNSKAVSSFEDFRYRSGSWPWMST